MVTDQKVKDLKKMFSNFYSLIMSSTRDKGCYLCL